MTWNAALVPLLTFLNVLAGTLLIPVGRPFLAALHGDGEGGLHAFFSVNMLGAAVGAPVCAWLADRSGRRRSVASILSAIDGVMLLACTLPIPLAGVLGLRGLQGAAGVGALSVIMACSGGGRGQRHGTGPALVGGAVVAAIAAGAPLGVLALRLGPIAPVRLAGALALLVALGTLALGRCDDATTRRIPISTPRTLWPSVRWPALLIGAERFAVGCFVVTFSLHAHLGGLSDREVGRMFSFFLLPFAIASWPIGKLGMRLERNAVLLAGLALYGASFLALAAVSVDRVALVLIVAGCASAAIYGPSLCLAASRTAAAQRATAMGLVNAAGTLGMLLGTAVAGVTSLGLQRLGLDRGEVYPWIFRLAGASQLFVLALALRPLVRLQTLEELPTCGGVGGSQ